MTQLIALQMVSKPDVSANLTTVEKYLSALDCTHPTLVVLPECFAFFGGKDKDLLSIAEQSESGPILSALRELAQRYKVWIVSGTIPVAVVDEEKFTASCFVIDDMGNIRGHYQKMHLFDVDVADQTKSYRESNYTAPGNKTLVVRNTPFGNIAVAVCYDLRFSGQFLAMQPFDVLVLPAAFTQKTGEAHWHPLLQSRSIEFQCYTVAANQGGKHANDRETFGHSCIYSPWGELISEKSKGEGFAMGYMDLSHLQQIRATMPVTKQNRFRSQLV